MTFCALFAPCQLPTRAYAGQTYPREMQSTRRQSWSSWSTSTVVTSRKLSWRICLPMSSRPTKRVSHIGNSSQMSSCADGIGLLVRAQIKKDVSVIKPAWLLKSIKRRRPLPLLKECVSIPTASSRCSDTGADSWFMLPRRRKRTSTSGTR